MTAVPFESGSSLVPTMSRQPDSDSCAHTWLDTLVDADADDSRQGGFS